MLLCLTENMNPNYNIIRCFVEKIPKQHLKFVLYQNKVCDFLSQVPPILPILLPKKTFDFIFFSSSLFSRTLPLLEPSQVTSL